MKSRSFRRKGAPLSFADAEDEDEQDQDAIAPARLAADRKAKSKGSQKDKRGGAGKLSFHEAEETASLPRPSERRPTLQLNHDSYKQLNVGGGSNGAYATQAAASGEYTADKLRELRKQAISYPVPRAPTEDAQRPVAAPAFKLSGSFKPATAAADDRFQAPEAKPSVRSIKIEDEDSDADAALLPPPPRTAPKSNPIAAAALRQQQQSQAAAAVKAEEPEDDDGFIPNAETIRKAKERRERLRYAQPAPDYVPLASGMAPAEAAATARPKKGESESDEEGEDDPRLRMTFLGRDKPDKQQKPVFAPADAHPEDNEDEDDDRWVDEQIRKGGWGHASSAAPQASGSAAAGQWAAQRKPLAPSMAPAQQLASVSADGEAVVSSLLQGLQRLQASKQQAQHNLARTEGNVKESIASIGRLEGDLATAGDKYTFLQEMRGYIADLCDMLQAKAPIVEELEEHLMKLGQHRAESYASRVAANDVDETEIASAAISAAMGVLARGGALAAATAAAERAQEAAEEQASSGSAIAEELDEFGRDLGLMRRQEEAERAAKRKQRAAARKAAIVQTVQGNAEDHQGDTTTDESDDEASHYRTRRTEILDTAGQVFSDADEAFASLRAVKGQLERWRGAYPEAYRDAYVSMSAPALMAPFVRSQLLSWDPLHGSQPGFDHQQWYEALFSFGMEDENVATNGSSNSADGDLVPSLVAQVVLPRAQHLLEAAWSPFSARASKQAAAVLGDLLVYVPADSARLQEVLRAVTAKLQAAAQTVKLPPWPSAATQACPYAHELLARRYGKAVRLLRSIAAFVGTLPRATLTNIAFNTILPQVLPYIRSASANAALTADRAQRLVGALPGIWLAAGSSSPNVKALVECLTSVARSMHSSSKASVTGSLDAGMTAARLSRMLQVLGAAEEAKRLTKSFR